MDRTATVTITISSDPRFSTRYFVDLRDTTGGANRQLRTWHQDAPAVRGLLVGLRGMASDMAMTLTVADKTGEGVDV